MPKALEDLQSIWNYTLETWSETQADKYHRMLEAACKDIADNPVIGRNYELVPQKYFGYKVGRHIIFYKFASPEHITVVRILHGSMDLKSRIG